MNNSIAELDQKIIWHPYTQALTAGPPITIVRGEGSYLYTQSGQKLFDGISSWWTSVHGHAHPHIAQAIFKQAQELDHVAFASFTHAPAVSLAKRLLEKSRLDRVFYSDNGSTAVEAALKMAYHYWQRRGELRRHFIALKASYHGDTFGAMAVSERSVFTKPFWPLLFQVLFAKSPCSSELSVGVTEAELTSRALHELEALIKEHPRDIAGIIVEPMLQAAGGMRIFTAGFLAGIKTLCQKHDLLLIADEVATGFYRTGPIFASMHEAVKPDIMCLSKGLTGGVLPLAATLATETIYEAFLSEHKSDALLHGHSFTANPIGCAAALASLELFDEPDTQDRIQQIQNTIERKIAKFRELATVKNARHLGTIAIIELKDDEAGYLSKASEHVFKHCYQQGLYIRPLGNVIYLMPPYSANSSEIEWALDLIYEAMA